MNIFSVISNLYTNPKCDWIKEIDVEEEKTIQPFIIQRWLAMNDAVRVQTRWLDKYIFYLTPKMYLSLAWSVLPKTQRAPFVKYISKQKEEEEFDFILKLVRKHFNLADNDYNAVKDRLIEAIRSDMVKWFSYYGIPKKYWKRYQINFKLIKEFGKENEVKKQTGLNKWGI